MQQAVWREPAGCEHVSIGDFLSETLFRIGSVEPQGLGRLNKIDTWLILPVVICLSKGLSHACLSISNLYLRNCEWLIKSVIVYLIVSCYMDTGGKVPLIHATTPQGVYLLDTNQPGQPVYVES